MTDKAASALIPILLVPQIILSGAQPFPFERMAHLHWPGPRPANSRAAAASPPWAAQLMPSRWGYEALICLQRDFGFEQAYHDALATVSKSRREPGTVSDSALSAAQEVKASGEGDSPNSARRMTIFYNEFSRDISPSRDLKLPWASDRVSRVFWNANVLGAMALGWLLLAWLVLKYGRPIRNLWGGRA
jgi:hypothetical protein